MEKISKTIKSLDSLNKELQRYRAKKTDPPMNMLAVKKWEKSHELTESAFTGKRGKKMHDLFDQLEWLELKAEEYLMQLDRLLDINQSVGTGRLRIVPLRYNGRIEMRPVFKRISRSKFSDDEHVTRARLKYLLRTAGVLKGSKAITEGIVNCLSGVLAHRERLERKQVDAIKSFQSLIEESEEVSQYIAMHIGMMTERHDFDPKSYERVGEKEANFNEMATSYRAKLIQAGVIETIKVSTKRRVKRGFGNR